MDSDGNGKIDMSEFEAAFAESLPQHVRASVDEPRLPLLPKPRDQSHTVEGGGGSSSRGSARRVVAEMAVQVAMTDHRSRNNFNFETFVPGLHATRRRSRRSVLSSDHGNISAGRREGRQRSGSYRRSGALRNRNFDLFFAPLMFAMQGTGYISAAALLEVLKACGDMGQVSPDHAIQWLQQASYILLYSTAYLETSSTPVFT